MFPMIPSAKSHPAVAAAIALVLSAPLLAANPQTASSGGPSLLFNRDIRPILTDNCFQCHGPDPGSRKAGLRLDTREGMLGTTRKDGPVVDPGKPESSALWKHVSSAEKDFMMPPPDSRKALKPEQRERLQLSRLQAAPRW